MIQREFTLMSTLNEPIRGTIRYLPGKKKLPVVVVCHGFKGFKDWGFHPYLGQQLAEAGFCAVHFNFSRNGVGEDLQNFTEFNKFRNNTYSIELDDLQTMLDALDQPPFTDDPLGLNRIGLIGHSRGGGIAILGAVRDPGVKCLVTWASVASLDRYSQSPEIIDLWRKQGFLEIPNARTGQMLHLGTDLMDDYLADPDKFDVQNAAASLEIPVAVIHGSADETVPFSEGQALHRLAPNSKLVKIKEAGHTFGAVHPWASTTDHLEETIQTTIRFLKRNLK